MVCLAQRPTIRSCLLHWVCFHAIERPLSVWHAVQEAASLKSGVSVAPVLGHAIQKSPVVGLSHVLLEVLGIGENLSTLLESLGVGQVSSSQPTGIPHTAQREGRVLETLTVRLIETNKTNKTRHAQARSHTQALA